nr:23S rRNA (guanosine(2251)-2'-O)-methyltransferase RlmB [Blattabacterium cuenoti]
MKKSSIVYGIHPLIEAIQANKKIKTLFLQKEKGSSAYKKLIQISRKKNIKIQIVPQHQFFKLKNKNHQGVFAEIDPIKTFSIKHLLPLFLQKKNPILIILDRITDVRNFGSIIRTSVCAGADAIIIPHKSNAMIGSDTIKTSSGAVFKIPICREQNIINTIKFLINHGIKIISAIETSPHDWYTVDFSGPFALILGNEEKGISQKYLEISCETVKIPSIGGISSLNVSVACGILLYEVFRQRKLN